MTVFFWYLSPIERRDALLGRAVLLVVRRCSSSASSSRCHGSSSDARSLIFRFSGVMATPAARTVSISLLRFSQSSATPLPRMLTTPLAEDAARQQVQGELAHFVYDRVARVAAALIADDHVKVLRQVVDHAALALVTPVDAYDRTICHKNNLRSVSRAAPRPVASHFLTVLL